MGPQGNSPDGAAKESMANKRRVTMIFLQKKVLLKELYGFFDGGSFAELFSLTPKKSSWLSANGCLKV